MIQKYLSCLHLPLVGRTGWGLLILAITIFPLPASRAQEKSLPPINIKADKEKVADIQSKILANLDTTIQNYQARIADLKAQLAAQKVVVKKSHKHYKKTVAPESPDTSLKKYVAAESNFKLPIDTISTVAPKLVAHKKPGFFKRIFSKLKKKHAK